MSFGTTMIVILSGLDVTLRVTLYSLLYGLPFALLFGALQYRAGSWRRWIVTAIIEFWRSSSVVILLFFFFYVLPAFDLKLSAMSVSSLVLGINIGAYGSQVVRGALQSVERGQIEAGLSLGLPRLKVLLLVEFPQAVRLMIPTFINETIQLTLSCRPATVAACSRPLPLATTSGCASPRRDGSIRRSVTLPAAGAVLASSQRWGGCGGSPGTSLRTRWRLPERKHRKAFHRGHRNAWAR